VKGQKAWLASEAESEMMADYSAQVPSVPMFQLTVWGRHTPDVQPDLSSILFDGHQFDLSPVLTALPLDQGATCLALVLRSLADHIEAEAHL
jgi:hypothetical protein